MRALEVIYQHFGGFELSQHDESDQEPQEAAGQLPATEQTKNANQRRSFANARRELSEEELSTPVLQKLLIDEVERLEAYNNELSSYRFSSFFG